MSEPAILEPDAAVDGTEGEEAQPAEVPSVFSVTNRHLVGAADVSPPAEDGSRVLRLISANSGTVIEANLAPNLCEFISGALVAVEVIAETDVEVEDDAGPKE